MKIVMMTAFEVNMSEFQSMFPNSPVDSVKKAIRAFQAGRSD